MNFKFLFITILSGTISITPISYNSDTRALENKSDEAKTPVNIDTFLPAQKLPKGSSSLNFTDQCKRFCTKKLSGVHNSDCSA
jgi:hypothetical protein